jgi:hypothetical protein
LAGAFLAAFFVAFLVAFFIEPFLPNVNLQSYRSQCDSYIRFFSREVKRKIIKALSKRLPKPKNGERAICFTLEGLARRQLTRHAIVC